MLQRQLTKVLRGEPAVDSARHVESVEKIRSSFPPPTFCSKKPISRDLPILDLRTLVCCFFANCVVWLLTALDMNCHINEKYIVNKGFSFDLEETFSPVSSLSSLLSLSLYTLSVTHVAHDTYTHHTGSVSAVERRGGAGALARNGGRRRAAAGGRGEQNGAAPCGPVAVWCGRVVLKMTHNHMPGYSYILVQSVSV